MSWVADAYRDTWLLSTCSHVNISYNGQDRFPCIPHMPDHSLDRATNHSGEHYTPNYTLSPVMWLKQQQLHKRTYLCIHTTHLCCDSTCWRDIEPAPCHTRQCLRDVQGWSEHQRPTNGHRLNETLLNELSSQTHPHTCCHGGSSPVYSPGICSPAALSTSYTSSNKLQTMRDREIMRLSIWAELKHSIKFTLRISWWLKGLSEAPAQAPLLSLELFSLK